MSKLEAPSSGLTKHHLRSFMLTPQGVQLEKGEEMGMFRMGSTIALIFECPRDYEITRGPGEKVKLGQQILAAKRETKVES